MKIPLPLPTHNIFNSPRPFTSNVDATATDCWRSPRQPIRAWPTMLEQEALCLWAWSMTVINESSSENISLSDEYKRTRHVEDGFNRVGVGPETRPTETLPQDGIPIQHSAEQILQNTTKNFAEQVLRDRILQVRILQTKSCRTNFAERRRRNSARQNSAEHVLQDKILQDKFCRKRTKD